jgi:hypothetical protein
MLVLGGTTIGFALGGRRQDIRVVLGFATGARNVRGGAHGGDAKFRRYDPDVRLMGVIVTLVMAGLQVPLAKWLGWRAARHEPAAPERRAP